MLMKGSKILKKILIVGLILLLIFAIIRITTSTYENIKRGNKAQEMPLPTHEITTSFSSLT